MMINSAISDQAAQALLSTYLGSIWLTIYCLACEAEARHMYCFSGGVVVVGGGGGGVNFLCLGHFLGNYKG